MSDSDFNKFLLFEHIRKEEIILWVGAGMSLYAGYPSGKKLAQILYDDIPENQRPLLDIYNKNDPDHPSRPLPTVAEEYCQLKGNKKHDLYKILLKNFPSKPPKPAKYHEIISEMRHFKTIVTTNYDQLFELSYGSECIKVVSETQIPYLDSSDKVEIFKIHGDIEQIETVLITDSDYRKFFADGTEQNALWTVVKARMATNNILFLGYSMEDINVGSIYDKFFNAFGYHGRQNFLATPGLSQHKIAHLAERGIKYIDCFGETLIEEIRSNIKLNILKDFENQSVREKTLNKFLQHNSLVPLYKVEDSVTKLVGIQPIGDKFSGRFTVTLPSDSPKNEQLKKLLDGTFFGKLILDAADLANSSLTWNDILIHTDLIEVEISDAPFFSGHVDIAFDNGFYYANILVECFRNPEGLKVLVKLVSAHLELSFRPKSEVNDQITFQMNFIHEQYCSSVREEIDLFKLLSHLADNEKFSINKDGKSTNKTSLKSFESNSEYFNGHLQYFSDLRRVELHYNKLFRSIEFREINDSDDETLKTIIQFIDKTVSGPFKKAKVSINDDKQNRNDQVKSISEIKDILIAPLKAKPVILYGQEFDIGKHVVYVKAPKILNKDSFISGSADTLEITSSIDQTYLRLLPEDEDPPLDL